MISITIPQHRNSQLYYTLAGFYLYKCCHKFQLSKYAASCNASRSVNILSDSHNLWAERGRKHTLNRQNLSHLGYNDWWWRQQGPLKRRLSQINLDGFITKKPWIFIYTVSCTSNSRSYRGVWQKRNFQSLAFNIVFELECVDNSYEIQYHSTFTSTRTLFVAATTAPCHRKKQMFSGI
jgi:hypothetical protein